MPRRVSGVPLWVRSMYGLGDACYQRPFVRAQAETRPVYLTNPWPEMWADLPNVFMVKPPNMPLRTQAKNMARQSGAVWHEVPQVHEKAYFSYALRRPGTILDELEKYVPLDGRPFRFDLPDFGDSPVTSSKPIAVLRPVTTRKEWANTARAPRPEYIAQAALALKHAGFHVVAVADLDGGIEWLEGAMPEADEYFLRGELAGRDLLALIQRATVVVGGSGFIVPISIAAGTPLVVIHGGQGGHNAPGRITDPRMDLRRTRHIIPDRFCMCIKMAGRCCNKSITDFPQRFRAALLDVTRHQLAEAVA